MNQLIVKYPDGIDKSLFKILYVVIALWCVPTIAHFIQGNMDQVIGFIVSGFILCLIYYIAIVALTRRIVIVENDILTIKRGNKIRFTITLNDIKSIKYYTATNKTNIKTNKGNFTVDYMMKNSNEFFNYINVNINQNKIRVINK